MIEMQFINNKACVFSALDWKKLRTEYRITGESLGSNQNNMALPMCVLPEEVVLLTKKGIAKLVTYPALKDEPTESSKKEYETFRQNLLEEHHKLYKESRRQDVENMVDKIIEGKRKRGRASQGETREEIFENEMQKINVTESSMVWPLLKSEMSPLRGPAVDVDIENILKLTTITKCSVYADLWEKGFHITVGQKFGGDFLAYLGDSAVFHAAYIIRCVEDEDKEIHPSELVAFGRIASSVKKHAVFASYDKGLVKYITVNWDEDLK